MAYVCLHVGFKLGLPDRRWPLSTRGLKAAVHLLPMACGIALCLASVAVAATPAGAAHEAPSEPAANPSARGLTAEGIASIDAFLRSHVQADGYLGAVNLVARDDRIVQSGAYGSMDLARSRPMREDSIFRIYSMTKTVTTVAVLMLVEEGKVSLDAPLETYLPRFAALQVYQADATRPDGYRLRAPASKPTVRQLLIHTAGFATVAGEAPTAMLERADLHGSANLAEFSDRLAQVPLAVDPGTRFAYDGTQVEVAARIVEVASGQSFDRFVSERILTPLRMADTGFSVPTAQRARVVDLTTMGADGALAIDGSPSAREPGISLNPYPGGAGGLYSTAPDFMRLCRLLLDGGELDGVRLLSRKTVADMRRNQLTDLDPPTTQFSRAEGFGLGGSVLLDPPGKGRVGAPGQYGWSGAASTYFMIDPAQDLIAILLLQHLPNDAPNDLPRLATPYYNLVQQALAP